MKALDLFFRLDKAWVISDASVNTLNRPESMYLMKSTKDVTDFTWTR